MITTNVIVPYVICLQAIIASFYLHTIQGFVQPHSICRLHNPAQQRNVFMLNPTPQLRKLTASKTRLFAASGKPDGVENPMNPERYTEKAWEAIVKLPQYADKYGQQYVEATFVLKGLLDEGAAGLAQRVLTKAGVDIPSFDR